MRITHVNTHWIVTAADKEHGNKTTWSKSIRKSTVTWSCMTVIHVMSLCNILHFPSFTPQLWVPSWPSPPSQTFSSKTTVVSTTLWSSLWSGCTAQQTQLMQPSPGQRMERLLSMTPPTSASGAPAVECLLPHHLLLITFRHQTMAAMCVRLGMGWWQWTAPHCLSQVGQLHTTNDETLTHGFSQNMWSWFIVGVVYALHLVNSDIRESVDALCRDGMNT